MASSVTGVLRSPSRLATNASALMLSSLATGVLGLVYWIVAERMLPTAAVGQASAVVSTATVLSSLACLSLGGAFQRFLPVAGRRSGVLIAGGYALTGTTAVLLGAGFVVTGVGDRILLSSTEKLLFVAMVLAFTWYALTDPILTGLRRAPAVAVKNITLSIAKILPLLLLGGSGSALAITASWSILAAVLTAVFGYHIVRICLGRRADSSANLPPAPELMSYQGAFFAMMLAASMTPLLLPLIVVAEAGTTENAYFNLAWTMCTALALLRAAVGSAFIVEASAPGADRAHLFRQLIRMLFGVAVLSSLALAIAGPAVLWFVGPEYLRAAAPLMLIMAAESYLATILAVYYLIAQLRRRLRLMLVAQLLVVAITVGGTYLLLPQMGLTAVGIATVCADVVVLAVVAGPLRRGVREILTAPTAASEGRRIEHC